MWTEGAEESLSINRRNPFSLHVFSLDNDWSALSKTSRSRPSVACEWPWEEWFFLQSEHSWSSECLSGAPPLYRVAVSTSLWCALFLSSVEEIGSRNSLVWWPNMRSGSTPFFLWHLILGVASFNVFKWSMTSSSCLSETCSHLF